MRFLMLFVALRIAVWLFERRGLCLCICAGLVGCGTVDGGSDGDGGVIYRFLCACILRTVWISYREEWLVVGLISEVVYATQSDVLFDIWKMILFLQLLEMLTPLTDKEHYNQQSQLECEMITRHACHSFPPS